MHTKEEIANYLAQGKLRQLAAGGLPKALSLIPKENNEFDHFIVDGNIYQVWSSAIDGIYDRDEVTVSADVQENRRLQYVYRHHGFFTPTIASKEKTFKKTVQESQPRLEDTQEDNADFARTHYPPAIRGVYVSLDWVHRVLHKVGEVLSNSSGKTVYLLVERRIKLRALEQYNRNLENLFPVKVVQSKVYPLGWLRQKYGVCTFLLKVTNPWGIFDVFRALTRSIDLNEVGDYLGFSYGVFSSQSVHLVLKEIMDRYDTPDVFERRIDSFIGLNELDTSYLAYSLFLSLCTLIRTPPIEFAAYGSEAPPELVRIVTEGNEPACLEKPT